MPLVYVIHDEPDAEDDDGEPTAATHKVTPLGIQAATEREANELAQLWDENAEYIRPRSTYVARRRLRRYTRGRSGLPADRSRLTRALAPTRFSLGPFSGYQTMQLSPYATCLWLLSCMGSGLTSSGLLW